MSALDVIKDSQGNELRDLVVIDTIIQKYEKEIQSLEYSNGVTEEMIEDLENRRKAIEEKVYNYLSDENAVQSIIDRIVSITVQDITISLEGDTQKTEIPIQLSEEESAKYLGEIYNKGLDTAAIIHSDAETGDIKKTQVKVYDDVLGYSIITDPSTEQQKQLLDKINQLFAVQTKGLTINGKNYPNGITIQEALSNPDMLMYSDKSRQEIHQLLVEGEALKAKAIRIVDSYSIGVARLSNLKADLDLLNSQRNQVSQEQSLSYKAEEAIDNFAAITQKIGKGFSDMMKGAFSAVKEATTKALPILNKGLEKQEKTKDKNIFEKIKYNSLVSQMTDCVSTVTNTIKNIAQGYKDKISEAKSYVQEFASEVKAAGGLGNIISEKALGLLSENKIEKKMANLAFEIVDKMENNAGPEVIKGLKDQYDKLSKVLHGKQDKELKKQQQQGLAMA